jgi:hypothetical protein
MMVVDFSNGNRWPAWKSVLMDFADNAGWRLANRRCGQTRYQVSYIANLPQDANPDCRPGKKRNLSRSTRRTFGLELPKKIPLLGGQIKSN